MIWFCYLFSTIYCSGTCSGCVLTWTIILMVGECDYDSDSY